MSLVKIPCILVAMVGLQVAVTPPHPPPSAKEAAFSTRLEGIVKQRSGPFTVKAICWGAALAEIAVILASTIPGPSSASILSRLVVRGSPELVRASPLFFLGTALTAFGGYIRYRCYAELGKLFTFEMSIREDHKLVTTGPYSVVRHPGYTGVLCFVTGVICWHLSPGSWAAECGIFGTIVGQVAAGTFLTLVSLITAGLLSRMSKEDEALHREFGQAWVEWSRSVPHKLIPGVY